MPTRRPGLPAVILKIGTLDDPALFGTPQMAIYTVDKQPFHQIPEGLPTFERLPKRQVKALILLYLSSRCEIDIKKSLYLSCPLPGALL